MASFAVCLLLALVVICAPAARADALSNGGWYYGARAQSCNTVCAAASAPCRASSMQAVNTLAIFNNILARVGNPVTCTTTPVKQFVHSPSIDAASKICYFNGPISTCDAPSGAGAATALISRICCCSNTDCLLTLPINAVVSAWGTFSACSAQCGTGLQTRYRTIVTPAKDGGSTPSLSETVTCNTAACAQGWVKADPNQSCTEACVGKQPCNSASLSAIDTLVEFDYVNRLFGYPTKCESISSMAFSHAPSYTATTCYFIGGSGNCGVRFQLGNRMCCCSATGCATRGDVRNCALGQWSAWTDGDCSVSCGGGVRLRRRVEAVSAANGGAACTGALVESQSCNTGACPIDCKLSVWNAWGACSATCGTGTQTRVRTVLGDAYNGGAACSSLSENKSCDPALPSC